jgi:hypothetical protein
MDNYTTKQALEGTEARIMKKFEEVSERVERTETALLGAFRDWSIPIDLRLRTLPLLEQRLGLVEERLGELERKVLEQGI